MRSGTASTERGNTYEQRVRAWRVAELIADSIVEASRPRSISFQHPTLLPWGNIVESSGASVSAWYIEHLDGPIPTHRLAQLLQTLHSNQELERATLVVDHTQTRASGLDFAIVEGLARASRLNKGTPLRLGTEEQACLNELAGLLAASDGRPMPRLATASPGSASAEAEEQAIDHLAEVFNDVDKARMLLDKARFPSSMVPAFSSPLVFWSSVAREARSGLLPDGVRPILEAAARLYRHNPTFSPFQRSRLVNADDLDVSSLPLDNAFRTLGRLHLQVLHDQADVRERSIRALRPFFEEPKRLVRHLLDFVVDSCVPGERLQFDELMRRLPGAVRRPSTPWLPVPSGPPDEEVLLWRRDHRGRARTLWLSSKEPGLIVADLPEMLLGSEGNLWRWDPGAVLVPFGNYDDFAFDEDPDVEDVKLKPVPTARLTNVEHGAIIPLGVIEDNELGEWVLEVHHRVEPIGTFGDIFLSWAHVDYFSGGAHKIQHASFIALDLQTGQPFALLDQEEVKTYLAQHGERARRDLPKMEDSAIPDEDGIFGEPELTVFRPFYDDSYALRLNLQISFETCYALTDRTWHDYYASESVETDVLPATLAPLATAPAVLRTYWDSHPMDAHYGWTRVPTSGPARQHLERIVREHQSRLHSTTP